MPLVSLPFCAFLCTPNISHVRDNIQTKLQELSVQTHKFESADLCNLHRPLKWNTRTEYQKPCKTASKRKNGVQNFKRRNTLGICGIPVFQKSIFRNFAKALEISRIRSALPSDVRRGCLLRHTSLTCFQIENS